MALTPALLNLLGTVIWGDVAGLTIYRDHRGRLVAFPRATPKVPPSLRQVLQRLEWINYGEEWMSLDPAKKGEWVKATRKLSMPFCGIALYYLVRSHPADYPALAKMINKWCGANPPNPTASKYANAEFEKLPWVTGPNPIFNWSLSTRLEHYVAPNSRTWHEGFLWDTNYPKLDPVIVDVLVTGPGEAYYVTPRNAVIFRWTFVAPAANATTVVRWRFYRKPTASHTINYIIHTVGGP